MKIKYEDANDFLEWLQEKEAIMYDEANKHLEEISRIIRGTELEYMFFICIERCKAGTHSSILQGTMDLKTFIIRLKEHLSDS